MVFSGNLNGSGGITAASAGNGNVSLTNTNSYSGATIVSSGQLTLDYGTVTPVGGMVGGIVPPTSPVTLSGGTLAVNNYPLYPVNQAFVSTAVANFGSAVVVNLVYNQPVQVALNGITRSGGVLDLPATAATLTTTNSNSNGILGGYMTVNGYADWASVNGSGRIVSLSSNGGYSADTYSVGNNVNVTNANLVPGGSITVNSLRFNTPAVGNVALTGTMMLTSGGILVTPSMGNTSLAISGGALTASGTMAGNTLADVVVIQGDTGPLTIGSAITNSGGTAIGLTKGGPGMLALTAGSANTYTGPTTVSGGTLQGSVAGFHNNIAVNAGACLDFLENGALAVTSTISVSGSGTVSKDGLQSLSMGSVSAAALNVNSGTLNLSGNSSIGPLSGGGALGITGTLSENAATSSEFDGPLGGSGFFMKSGTGTLTLAADGTLSGTVRIGAGTLRLIDALALQDATVDMNAADLGTLSTSGAGLSRLTLGGLMGARNLSTPVGPLTIGAANNSTTYSGNLSGGTALNKTGSGSLYLSGTNSFAKATILGGALEAATTASLTFYGTPNAVSVAGGAGISVQTGDGLTGWSGSQIGSLLTNASWANNTAVLGVDTSNGNFTYGGNIAQALTKLGANTLTLTGSNTCSATSVSAGVLTAGSDAALGTGPLSVASGATVNFFTASPSIGGLSGSGSLVLGNSTGPVNTNLTVNSASNSTFSGFISQATSAVGSLIKSGTGTLTLGSANSYGGGTTINQGTLVAANGSGSATGSGPVTLNSGMLSSGTAGGTIGGNVLAGSGAYQIAPGGIGAIGSLSIGGSLGLNNNATLDFDLNGNSYDSLNISGPLAVNGVANLAFDTLVTTPTASAYVVATFATNNSLHAGNFHATGIPSGYTLQVNPTNLELVVGAAPPVTAIWSSPFNGNWSSGLNWSTSSAPSSTGAVAVVGTDTSSSTTITLDVSATLGQLTFSNSLGGSYTLAAGGGTLTMDNGTNNNGVAQILVASGSHSLSAPVILAGALSIAPSAGTMLGISGNISEQTPAPGAFRWSGPARWSLPAATPSAMARMSPRAP